MWLAASTEPLLTPIMTHPLPGQSLVKVTEICVAAYLAIDESTHQILSYGLLFSTSYCFPYTTGPPTSTTPMQPSPTFTQSPLTIPYTHRTIGPVPCRRPPIWPTDHIVTFSFLSLFSFTRRILSRSDQSQIVAPRDQDLTMHFTAHEPCARFTYCLYLSALKNKEVFPRTLSRLIVLLHSILYSWHTLPYHTIPNLHLTLLDTTSGDHFTALKLHPSEPHRIYT